ncbi:MAG TPA: LysR family transcriptional regulator [Candidatus Paceibacterota bacterium]|nr:LysR family transcriptional regulator [Candidatus Paceibacterota bacterium]
MEFLNYHHLRYFWTVAKEGGLTRAAAKLHVSQPTISAQIQALEGMLGEKLFRRVGRNLALTDTGQHILGFAEEIFSLGEDLLNSVKQRPTRRPLRLHIGVADALPKLVTYHIIEPVFRLPQAVQVSCWETRLSDMLVELAAYRMDVVLADEPASSGVASNVFNHLLGESDVTFCAAPALAAKLRRGFPKSLNGAPALLPMSHSGLRRSLERWFQTRGVRPRLVGEFEDAALVYILAGNGLGFMSVPSIVAKEAITRYGFRPIGRTDECQQHYYAITAESKLTHPGVLAITSTARRRLVVEK